MASDFAAVSTQKRTIQPKCHRIIIFTSSEHGVPTFSTFYKYADMKKDTQFSDVDRCRLTQKLN